MVCSSWEGIEGEIQAPVPTAGAGNPEPCYRAGSNPIQIFKPPSGPMFVRCTSVANPRDAPHIGCDKYLSSRFPWNATLWPLVIFSQSDNRARTLGHCLVSTMGVAAITDMLRRDRASGIEITDHMTAIHRERELGSRTLLSAARQSERRL
jgi:hypothetical protein